MKNPAARIVVLILAIAAMALAGLQASRLDAQIRASHEAMVSFETQARQATQSLASIAAAQRGYVADGQNSTKWQSQVANHVRTADPLLKDLRQAATTPEGQGVLESAIETMTSFGQSDAKARDYLNSGQRLSASDVVFADGTELLTKAAAAIEDARVRERARRETDALALRQRLTYFLGGGFGIALIALLALVSGGGIAKEASAQESEKGLGLSQGVATGARTASSPAMARPVMPPTGIEDTGAITNIKALGTAAQICGELARVRNPEELPLLLERVAGVLDATGIVIWMSEGMPGTLRPVLAHGYPSAILARLGAIEPDADNITAKAYRTKDVQAASADATGPGAIVAPMVIADGCTGVMAVELKKGIDAGDYLRAMAGIMAAQMATLITPAPAEMSAPAPPQPPPAPGAGSGSGFAQ